MGEGISYTFNIEPGQTGSKLDMLIASLGTLNTTLSKTDSAFKKTDEHAKKAEHGFRGVGSAIDGARESLRHMAEFTGGMLLFEGIEKGIDLVAELGKEAINAAAQAERLDLSFDLTMGAESARDILEYVEKIQSKTEFTDDQLKGWTLSLANAGLKGDDLYKSLVAAADVAGRRGPQAMETAVDALARANLTGKVEGRVLRGLGIPIAQLTELDKFKGMSDKQINKKLENTTITRDELLQVIAGPDKMLGDLAEKAGQTMNAKLKNVRTLPEQYFQKFAESPAYDRLKSKLDDIFTNLDPDSSRGKQIFAALDGAFTKIVDTVADIDFVAVANTITDDVIPAVTDLVGAIRPTLDVITTTIRGFGVAAHFLSGNQTAKEKHESVNAYDANTEQAKFGEHWYGRLWANVKAPFLKSAAGLEKPYDSTIPGARERANGMAVAEGFAAGVKAGLPAVQDAMTTMSDAAPDAVESNLEIQSPSRVFHRIGVATTDGFAEGVEAGGSRVESSVDDTFAPPQLRGAGSRTVAASGGGVTIGSLSVTIQGAHDAAEIPPVVAAAVKAEIMRTLEDVRAERGT